mmetsp:Transcript_12174/g.23350  ORF Transcript_12174/g.23350 Transcript_12174/m.23350 type:complete len:214 (-) Transcript_12174:603-1244(-)
MLSLKVVLTLAPRMLFALRNKCFTSATIDAESTGAIEGTSCIFGTEFGGFELTVFTSVTQTVFVSLVTVTLEPQLVCFLIDTRDAFGTVHAGMGASRAHIETEFTGETNVSNGTHAVFKVLTMSRVKGAIETVHIELLENRKVFFTLATNAVVLALQVAGGVVPLVADTKFTDGSGEAFGAIATHSVVTPTFPSIDTKVLPIVRLGKLGTKDG